MKYELYTGQKYYLQSRIDVIRKSSLGPTVLDIGAGSGDVDRHYYTGQGVIALDTDLRSIRKAREHGFDPVVGDGTFLPFKDSVFDSVVATEVIEHVFDTDKLLRQIRRVLRPKGNLILSTPNLCSLRNRVKVLFGRQPSWVAFREKDCGSHIRSFSPEALRKLLVENGFVVKRVASNVVILKLSMLVNKLFRKICAWLGQHLPTYGEILIVEAIKT